MLTATYTPTAQPRPPVSPDLTPVSPRGFIRYRVYVTDSRTIYTVQVTEEHFGHPTDMIAGLNKDYRPDRRWNGRAIGCDGIDFKLCGN